MGIFSRKPQEPAAGRPSVAGQLAFADQLKAQALQLQLQARQVDQAAVGKYLRITASISRNGENITDHEGTAMGQIRARGHRMICGRNHLGRVVNPDQSPC